MLRRHAVLSSVLLLSAAFLTAGLLHYERPLPTTQQVVVVPPQQKPASTATPLSDVVYINRTQRLRQLAYNAYMFRKYVFLSALQHNAAIHAVHVQAPSIHIGTAIHVSAPPVSAPVPMSVYSFADMPVSLQPFFTCVAGHESGGDYRAVNPSGVYRGRYQMDANYWHTYAPAKYRGMSDWENAPPSAQDEAASAGFAARGPSPWDGATDTRPGPNHGRPCSIYAP